MQFIDEARVRIKAGNGGRGSASFLREKFRPRGGPDGGDGGRGGDVIIVCTAEINTLLDFMYSQNFEAENGEPGRGRNQHGKNGKDLTIKVPPGTQIFLEDGETLLLDMIEDGEEFVLAKGGNGGFGNVHFKSSINQSPRRANPGAPGDEMELVLRLKILSDVGLVGLPNAGKSTFLSVVTRARPKIADYPFTTLEPQLGVAVVDDYDFVIADLPGLIEGASEGKGLGDRFLKHTERCAVLLHLIDANSDDIVRDYRLIMNELKKYSKVLAKKTMVVALTKIDALIPEILAEKKTLLEKEIKNRQRVFVISSVSRQGTEEVMRELKKYVIAYKKKERDGEGD